MNRIRMWYRRMRLRYAENTMSHKDYLRWIVTETPKELQSFMESIDCTNSNRIDFSRGVWGHSIGSEVCCGLGRIVMGWSRKYIKKHDILTNGTDTEYLVLSVEYETDPPDMFNVLVVGYKREVKV